MNKQLGPFWQAFWVLVCGICCVLIAVGGRHYRQQKNWDRFPGTYYAYVHDNGVVHKVRLTIPPDQRVATLKIVDSTDGESTHVSKVNHLKINRDRQTMKAVGYPGFAADHYRHVGSTIRLTTAGVTRVYYRTGTPAQQQQEQKFRSK